MRASKAAATAGFTLTTGTVDRPQSGWFLKTRRT